MARVKRWVDDITSDLTGAVIDAEDAVQVTIKGYKRKNWKPLDVAKGEIPDLLKALDKHGKEEKRGAPKTT